MNARQSKQGEGMERRILIADEVAELLRVDRQRVYELVRRNAIPVIRLGERQYRFDAEAIERWIEDGGKTGRASDGKRGSAI